MRSRFAPSTTGEAHPGTFLSALLVILDARLYQLETLLRLEDLDPSRSSPDRVHAMRADLAWLGLDFDVEAVQSRDRERHEAALDRLDAEGRLYPCPVSRRELAEDGTRAPDGSFRYDNRNRRRPMPQGGWRESVEPIRVQLDPVPIRIEDGSRAVLEHRPEEFGDPVVRRRDGAVSYQLASVVDDAAEGVSRVIRGMDLFPTTTLQVALQRVLGLDSPAYHHHPLLLERRGEKLSKMHGAIGAAALRQRYRPEELTGVLLYAVGAVRTPAPIRWADVDFDWQGIEPRDVEVDVRPDGELKPVKR